MPDADSPAGKTAEPTPFPGFISPKERNSAQVDVLTKPPSDGVPTLDFSMFAPVVAAWQEGEIEKTKVAQQANIAIAEMGNKRQMEVDKATAAREHRQDRYEIITTSMLYTGCVILTGYGMWAHDNGFITAGISSFASFLAGRRGGAVKAKKE